MSSPLNVATRVRIPLGVLSIMPQVSVVLRPLTWALVVSVNEPLAASGFGGHAGAAGGGLVAPRADESARGCVT